MTKKQYTTPVVEVLELRKPNSMLAHFSADADFIGIEEMDPEVLNPDAPY